MVLNLSKRNEGAIPLTWAQVDQNWTDIEGAINDAAGYAVSVAEFGVVGDGVTSDDEAFQDAADAGVPLYIPGEFNCLFTENASVIVTTDTFTLYGPGKITCAPTGGTNFRAIDIGNANLSNNTSKSRIIIDGVTFESAHDEASSVFIQLENAGGDLTDVIIRHNRFIYTGGHTDPSDRWAISFGGGSGDLRARWDIEHNHCEGRWQLCGNGQNANYEDIRIRFNTIYNSQNAGIALSRPSNVTTNTYDRIDISENYIYTEYGNIGIFFGGDGSTSGVFEAADVSIAYNTIYCRSVSGTEQGILVRGTSDASVIIDNIAIIGNVIDAPTECIRLTGSGTFNGVIANNHCHTGDMLLYNGTAIVVKSNTLLTGKIHCNNEGRVTLSDNDCAGVRVEDGVGATIVDSFNNRIRVRSNADIGFNVVPIAAGTITFTSTNDEFHYIGASGTANSGYYFNMANAGAAITAVVNQPRDNYGAASWSNASGIVRVNAGPTVTYKPVVSNDVSADKGDAAATLTPLQSEQTSVWNTAIGADRAVTLNTTKAFKGAKFKIVRTAAATGAFNLNVGTGPLKALAVGTWCEVEYNGTAWILSAYGAL